MHQDNNFNFHYDEWRKQNYNDDDNIDNLLYLYRDYTIKYIDDNINNNNNNPFYIYTAIQSMYGPLEYVKKYDDELCAKIGGDHEKGVKYCQLLRLSDDVIGSVIDKLHQTEEWKKTLIILTTDNGGDLHNTGCNYPLRGSKGTVFEGNQRVISVVSGGVIPKKEYGTTRDSLFSSLDWTPTLLQFAGVYDEISETDKTWDGINQYDLIMYGDDSPQNTNNNRDHIVLNIALRNLESASIIFKYDNNIYKYIATDPGLDNTRDDGDNGWCIIDGKTGDLQFKLKSDGDRMSYSLDHKYLFDLDGDISETNNILKNAGKYNVDELRNYALSILNKYVQHPLFAESIKGLREYRDEEDNNGAMFIGPFITKSKYINLINKYLDTEINENDNPISDELRKLYTEKWISPLIKSKKNNMMNENINIKTINLINNYYIYGVVAIFLIILIIIKYYKSYKKDNYKYIPIHDNDENIL